MSEAVTLSLRVPIEAETRLEVEGVAADRFAALSSAEIARLPAWLGRREAKLGDFFDVQGERSARVRIEGMLTHVDGLAAGMSGGELIVAGDVGGRLGVGMTGGEIIVRGSAGAGAGARVRRGLVVVTGDVGGDAGRGMIAGTLVVFGRTGADPGQSLKRGTIVAIGAIDVPQTYRYACTFQPPHIRLTMTYLRRQHHLAIDDDVVTGRYRRYCGDLGAPGKGEILALVPA